MQRVTELFEHGRDDVLFAVVIAARANAERHDRVDALFDVPHEPHDFFDALDRHFDLDNGRHELLVQDVLAQRAGRDVGHERRNRILLLEGDAGIRQRPAHELNLTHPDADAWASELNREAGLTGLHAATDIVGLHFFRAASFDTGRLMRHAGIGKRPADDARPRELIGLERGGRADIGLWIEAEPQHLKNFACGAHDRRIQVLLAEPRVARIALDAFMAVDHGALDRGIDVDGAHGAHIGAVSARDALIGIDIHNDLSGYSDLITIFEYQPKVSKIRRPLEEIRTSGDDIITGACP